MCCAFGPGSIASRGLLFGAPPHAEAASQISAPEWDVLSGWGFKRKLYPGFDAQDGIRFPVEASNGKCVPEYGFSVGCIFRLGLQTESASRNPRLEWDALSGAALNRKLRPGISLQSGMPFPAEPSGGKCIPELTLGVGHVFRNSSQAEAASRSEAGFRDTLSARPAIRKGHPVLSVQAGTRFPLAWPLGKRGPDRGVRSGNAWLNSPYSSTSLSHVGSAVCRIPAVCSFLASIPAERTSFMVKRSRGWP